jgi:TRAP-type C4-dicarboxylate transport system permease small subunit
MSGSMARIIDHIEEYVAVGMLCLMAIMVFTQVVLRFLFGLGFSWLDEISRILFIWVVYLGAVVAMHRGLHIRVEAGLTLFPARMRRGAFLLGELVLFVFCMLMAWHGVELVLSTTELSFRLPATNVSMFYPYLIMPISFLLQAIRLAMRHVRGVETPHA